MNWSTFSSNLKLTCISTMSACPFHLVFSFSLSIHPFSYRPCYPTIPSTLLPIWPYYPIFQIRPLYLNYPSSILSQYFSSVSIRPFPQGFTLWYLPCGLSPWPFPVASARGLSTSTWPLPRSRLLLETGMHSTTQEGKQSVSSKWT